ncbi:hypothetical protein QTP70_019500 [Hemibagrus guttatus]|uniref:Uncharacterized protein n=1 Tax=Hemibagrus guttatus TaxID=175788 RepID=A0AAE0QUU9_9TELE|nr:hypothetical protein QTP70_019500 [Hemibagrus guttatus]
MMSRSRSLSWLRKV